MTFDGLFGIEDGLPEGSGLIPDNADPKAVLPTKLINFK